MRNVAASDETVAPQEKQKSATKSSRGPYKVGVGDQLKVRVYPQRDLSQLYNVQADGTISFPLIGSIGAAGKTLREIESDLKTRLADLLKRDASVSIEIGRYRPVYVLGFVKTAGQYEWRPDLDVRQLVSLAGGYPQLVGRTQIDMEREQGRFARLKMSLAEARVRQARLNAELAEQTSVELPKAVTAIVGEKRASKMLALETSLLERRRQIRSSKDDSAKSAIALAQTEIKELEARRTFVNQQIELRSSVADKIAALVRRGHSSIERQALLQSEAIRLQAVSSEILGELAAARKRLAEAKERSVRSRLDEKLSIENELTTIDQRIVQLVSDLANSRSLLSRFSAMGCRPGNAGAPAPPKFQLHRRIDGADTERSVDASALIQPGDTLEVLRTATQCFELSNGGG